MVRIAVVGCGATGSVYAALLCAAGHEVHGIGRGQDHVAAVRAHGLRVHGASGDRTVRLRSMVQCSESIESLGTCDLVVIATKAYDVAEAAARARALIGPSTVVCTIQNGLGSAEAVAEVLGPQRLAVGVIGGFGASLVAPGVVHHHGMEMVRFGAFGGLSTEDLAETAALWRSAGFGVTIADDVERMVWEKIVMNVAFSPTTCLTGMTIGEVMADPTAWAVAEACLVETVGVAAAAGIVLDVGDPVEHVRALGGAIPHARPSMLIDHELGRRTEVDAIVGAVVRTGEAHGVDTPVIRTLADLIRARERLGRPEEPRPGPHRSCHDA